MAGPVLLEFGTNWCGYCRAFTPELCALMPSYKEVRHIRVEDGPGRALGRSFRVKLWPNLVLLRDGQVVVQLARPGRDQVREALDELTHKSRP